MKFTVTWTAAARSQLAEIWLNASDKERITESVRAIERLLARDVEDAGESRVVDIRILIEAPLAIYFDVRPLDR
jgi:hypothetical protein